MYDVGCRVQGQATSRRHLGVTRTLNGLLWTCPSRDVERHLRERRLQELWRICPASSAGRYRAYSMLQGLGGGCRVYGLGVGIWGLGLEFEV